MLTYSQHATGSYAFVLYYRMHRTPEADQRLKQAHSEFVAVRTER